MLYIYFILFLKANQFLPLDCGHLSNCLPTLITSATSFGLSRKQKYTLINILS